MKKIVIVIPCWKRADIVDIVSKQLDVFFSETINSIELTVLYVFSMEDPELDHLYSIYIKANHKRDCIFSGNGLLGRKLNDGIKYAEKFNYDYIMNFGSDDIIHPDIIQLYQKSLDKELDIIGLNSVFFYNNDADPILYSYYNKPFLIGAGRLIHRRVIESVVREYGGLYKIDLNRGMDTFSGKRMKSLGFIENTLNSAEFPYIVDIKSDVNINSYKDILENTNGSIKQFSKNHLVDKFNVLKCS